MVCRHELTAFQSTELDFARAWAILYIMIAIAGWRICRELHNSRSMKLWWAQLALIFIWSPIFFTAHRINRAAPDDEHRLHHDNLATG